MKVGALEESVTVSGASPVVDRSPRRKSATRYNREWVENAPVRRFSLFRSDQHRRRASARPRTSARPPRAQSLRQQASERQTPIRLTAPTSARRRGRTTPTPSRPVEVADSSAPSGTEYWQRSRARRVFTTHRSTRQGGNVFHRRDANFYLQRPTAMDRRGTRPMHRTAAARITRDSAGATRLSRPRVRSSRTSCGSFGSVP
jgi:hypothetical protein